MEYKIEQRLSKNEDAIAIWFKLSYSDIKTYSLTIEDAYRTPTAQIITEDVLNKFLEEW